MPRMPLRAASVLCLFAKRPRAGHVKTRLAATLGDARAAQLATAFLDDTIAALRRGRQPFVVAFDLAPEDDRPSDVRTVLQGPGDLGERLTRVLRALLAESRFAIALGSDTPGLPWAFVERAVEMLDDPRGPDVVIGPSSDGGFYLLGVRKLPAGSLAGVRWSTDHARADVEARLGALGMRIEHLSPWFDVDEVADLQRLMRSLEADPTLIAPATRRALMLAPDDNCEPDPS